MHKFIMGLNPISYTMTDGDSGRTHYGLGAQSVEKLMETLGMSSMDFAGFIKSPVTIDLNAEEFTEKDNSINYEKIPLQKAQTIDGEYMYGLRYEEFIAPLIKMVQLLQKEMESTVEETIIPLLSYFLRCRFTIHVVQYVIVIILYFIGYMISIYIHCHRNIFMAKPMLDINHIHSVYHEHSCMCMT